MHKVFITGSSIICALGNNKKESINKLKNINNKNYKEYLKENFEDINYYKIKQNFKTQKEKFFSILEKIKNSPFLKSLNCIFVSFIIVVLSVINLFFYLAFLKSI